MRLLAVDMDGTCLNDKKLISKQTLEALKAAAKAGIEVVPTTGRALHCLPLQLMKETFYRYVISSNGAAVTDLKTGNRLFDARIPYQDIINLIDESTICNLGVSVHLDYDFILQGRLLSLMGRLGYGKDAANTKCVKSISDLLKQKKEKVEELQLFYFTKSAKRRTENLLSSYQNLQMAYSNQYVEIYSAQASKGSALSALAETLKISPEKIACIGDSENDLPMFSASGFKFAMGNAIAELKSKADVVLPSNNEDGVADAIWNYLM